MVYKQPVIMLQSTGQLQADPKIKMDQLYGHMLKLGSDVIPSLLTVIGEVPYHIE